MDPIQKLARRLRGVERLAFKAATQPQLAYSSIEDGAIQSVEDGSLKAIIGKQFDGTQVISVFNGPVPPTPSAPGAVAALEGAILSWDGSFTDGSVAPMDFTRVEVHASTDPDFTAEFAETLKATFETPRGAQVFVALPGAEHYVRLVARTATGERSAASVATPVTPQALLDALPEPTDGLAPSSSPTPVVSGGVGSLFLSWVPTSNPDPITYEIHASLTAGFTPDGTTLVGETMGANYVLRSVPGDPDPISYTDLTYVRLVAKDVDGAAAPGAEVSGHAMLINSPDLAVSAITTDKLAANAVSADKLAATIVLGSQIMTGPSDQPRVLLDANGIQVLKADNSQRAVLPTDPASPVFIKGTAELDSAVINDRLTLRGTNNAVAPGTTLQLQGSVQDPQSQVSATVDWETVESWVDPTQFSYSIRGLDYNGGGGYVFANLFFGTQLLAYNEAGAFSGNVGLPNIPTGIGSNYSGTYQSYGGVVKVGANYYTLGTIHRISDNKNVWQVRKWTIDFVASTYTFVAYADIGVDTIDFNGSGTWPILGKGTATGLSLAWWAGVGGGNFVLHSQDINVSTCALTGVGTNYGPNVATGNIGDILYFEQSSFDYGAARTLFSHKRAGAQVIRAFNGTTAAPSDEFKLPGGTVSVCYNPTSTNSFRSAQVSGSHLYNVKHTLINWSTTTTTSNTWWGTFTYRNGANSYETGQSIYKSFTMEKRQRLTITTPAIPPGGTGVDPDRVKMWVGQGAAQPARTAMWTFAAPAAGVITATQNTQVFGSPNTNPPATNNFPASAASKLISADGTKYVDSDGNAVLRGVTADTIDEYVKAIGDYLSNAASGTSANGVAQNIGTVTFNARTNRRYRVHWGGNVAPGTSGQWIEVDLNYGAGATTGGTGLGAAMIDCRASGRVVSGAAFGEFLWTGADNTSINVVAVMTGQGGTAATFPRNGYASRILVDEIA